MDVKMAKKEKKEKGLVSDGKVPNVESRLRMLYKEKVIPEMMKEFEWKNPHQVPKLEKVIINMGVGEGSRDIKLIEGAVVDLSVIAGQKPVLTRARNSVAQFKIRTGMPVGLMVTIRGNMMYHFLEKLFTIALPRVRDFQGLNSNSFDGHGNYTLGIREQIVFPEINYNEITKVRGMDITIVTTAENDAEARSLLRNLGCPLRAK
jgi:large subunit ribosomal protein L5